MKATVILVAAIFLAFAWSAQGRARDLDDPDLAARAKAQLHCELARQGASTELPRSIKVPISDQINRESRVAPAGETVLIVKVGSTGKVEDVVVGRTSGNTRVDEIAIDSLRQASYSPGKLNGRPTRMCVPFRFVLVVPD